MINKRKPFEVKKPRTREDWAREIETGYADYLKLKESEQAGPPAELSEDSWAPLLELAEKMAGNDNNGEITSEELRKCVTERLRLANEWLEDPKKVLERIIKIFGREKLLMAVPDILEKYGLN